MGQILYATLAVNMNREVREMAYEMAFHDLVLQRENHPYTREQFDQFNILSRLDITLKIWITHGIEY